MLNLVLRYVFGLLYLLFGIKLPVKKAPLEVAPLEDETPTPVTTGVVKYEHELVATIRTYQKSIDPETLSDDLMDRRLLETIPSVFQSLEDLIESITVTIRFFDSKLAQPDERQYLNFENVTLRTRTIVERKWSIFLIFRGRMISIQHSYQVLDQFVIILLDRYHSLITSNVILTEEKLYFNRQINMLLFVIAGMYKIISERGYEK